MVLLGNLLHLFDEPLARLIRNNHDQSSHHDSHHRIDLWSHLVDPRSDAYPSTIQDGSLSDLWYHLYHCPTESSHWTYPGNVFETLTKEK